MKNPPYPVVEWLRTHNLLNTAWNLEECAHGGTAKLAGSINWGEPYVGTNASLEFTIRKDDSLRLALRYETHGRSIDYEWDQEPNQSLLAIICSTIKGTSNWSRLPADVPGQLLLEEAV